MRRIVLGAEDGGIGDGRGAGVAGATAGGVTLVLPETRSEYEKARAEVESLARAARGNEVTGPADGGPDGMDGTYAMPGAGRWVVTTGEQRRAWDLPDLGGVATVPASTHADLQRAWSRDTVPLVDADDAVRLLTGNDAGSRADGETGGVGGTRISGSVRSEHAAAEFVNLKHGRGPIPAHVRETFDELSGRPRIDALVDALDEVLGPLEQETLPRLAKTRRELASLRPLLQRELAPERLHAPRDAGPRAGGVLNLGGGLHPLLRRVRRVAATFERLDSSVPPDGEMSPSRIVQLIEQADNGVLDAAEMEAGAGKIDAALAACDKAVGQVIEPLRALFDVRSSIRKGGWDDADVRRAAALVRRVEGLRGALDEAGPSEKQVGGLRSAIKGIEEDRESAGRLGPRIRETLGRLEAMDLPAVVLDKALEELRRATTSGTESATASLERVRLLAALPWSRRAPERTDTAAAMRELDDAHEGRHEIKERIRRFLVVRTLLQQAAWTLEGYGLDGAPEGDGADCVLLRPIVVRNVRAAAPAPVLCFAGPPGSGKTSLAKRIAKALGRPAVTIARGRRRPAECGSNQGGPRRAGVRSAARSRRDPLLPGIAGMEHCPTCGVRHAGGPSCHRCRTDLRQVLAIERAAASRRRQARAALERGDRAEAGNRARRACTLHRSSESLAALALAPRRTATSRQRSDCGERFEPGPFRGDPRDPAASICSRRPSCARPARAADGRPACWSRSWRFRSPSCVRDELACLRLRATNTRGAEQHGSRAGPVDQTHAGYPGGTLRFGKHGVLELLRDASLDHLLGRDFDGFPGCWVATGPRFALLQDEFRDAGQRELAAILKLLLAQPLQLFEELPRVGALEADVDGSEMLDEMREQLGLAHFASFGHRCFPLL